MISQYDVQKLADLILENRDALNNLHTATTEQKMQAAFDFANTDRELFDFLEKLGEPATDDGWIEWGGGGGEQPVDDGKWVEVKLRDGNYLQAAAVNFEWRWGVAIPRGHHGVPIVIT